MIFSVNYQSEHKQEAGEIKCPYNQLGLIFDFIKSNPNKRINITGCDDTVDMKKLIEQVEFVKEVASDYTIECGNVIVFNHLKEHGYNAYLRFPVTDWETFQNLRKLEVSDIYIDGPLGFCRNNISFGKGNIKIRVSPTVSPNASLINRSICSFYIRPEDLKYYEDMIDIVDFKVDMIEREDALFSIYNRGEFYYPIDQLIPGLPSVSNVFFKEDFVNKRLQCLQKCMTPCRSCKHCETYFSVVEKMEELMKRSD